jgi:hypothetical protein
LFFSRSTLRWLNWNITNSVTWHLPPSQTNILNSDLLAHLAHSQYVGKRQDKQFYVEKAILWPRNDRWIKLVGRNHVTWHYRGWKVEKMSLTLKG